MLIAVIRNLLKVWNIIVWFLVTVGLSMLYKDNEIDKDGIVFIFIFCVVPCIFLSII